MMEQQQQQEGRERGPNVDRSLLEDAKLNKKPKVSNDLLYIDPVHNPHEQPFLLNQKPEVATSKTKPNITPVGLSSALSRAKGFLPLLKKANEDLEKQIAENPTNKEKFDIENIEDTSKPVIKMNIALGVLEEQRPLDETTFKISKENGDDSENDASSDDDAMEEDQNEQKLEKKHDAKEETSEGGTWLQSLVVNDTANKKKRRKKKKKALIQQLNWVFSNMM